MMYMEYIIIAVNRNSTITRIYSTFSTIIDSKIAKKHNSSTNVWSTVNSTIAEPNKVQKYHNSSTFTIMSSVNSKNSTIAAPLQ